MRIMLITKRIIRITAKRIADAIQQLIEEHNQGIITQEPDFTSRMVERIKNKMDDFHIKGIRWNAHVLSDRGPASEEKMHGADFVGVLNINIPGYSVKKGFLVQSKQIWNNKNLSQNEIQLLLDQCNRMLQLTPCSYVFIYQDDGVKIFPAISILASKGQFEQVYKMSVNRFYELHFESFIGDRRISTLSVEQLEKLRHEYNARHALMLTTESDENGLENRQQNRPDTVEEIRRLGYYQNNNETQEEKKIRVQIRR